MRRGLATWIAAAFILASWTVPAQAQYAQRARTPQRSQRLRSAAGIGYQGSNQDSIFNRPSVSPYLNLLRPQGLTSAPNYQGLVQPQQQQSRLNAQQSATIRGMQGDLTSLETRGLATGGMRPTGYTPAQGRSRFLDLGPFFSGGGGQAARRSSSGGGPSGGTSAGSGAY